MHSETTIYQEFKNPANRDRDMDQWQSAFLVCVRYGFNANTEKSFQNQQAEYFNIPNVTLFSYK